MANRFDLRPAKDGEFTGFHVIDNGSTEAGQGFVEASIYFQDESVGTLSQFSFIRSSLMPKEAAEDMITCLREAFKKRFGHYPETRKPKLEKKAKE